LRIGGKIFRVVEPFIFSAYYFHVQPLLHQIGTIWILVGKSSVEMGQFYFIQYKTMLEKDDTLLNLYKSCRIHRNYVDVI